MTDDNLIIGISALCGAMIPIFGVLALVWKVLLPWLRSQLVDPVKETQRQVSNDHTTNLRDDITEVRDLLVDHLKDADDDRTRLARLEAEVRTLRRPRLLGIF